MASCNIFQPSLDDYSNKILYTSNLTSDGHSQLFMVGPDGSNIQQITSGRYSHWRGKWSPDASQIACNTDQDATTNDIYMMVMKSNGTKRQLIHPANSFEWHPDGNEIICEYMPSAEMGYFTKNIYLAYEARYIIYNDLISQIEDESPCYSPNGDKIAFSSNREYVEERRAKSELYLMNSDGSNQRQITHLNELSTSGPVWTNDGNTLYFCSAGRISSYSFIDSLVTIICDSDSFAYVGPRLSPNNDKIIFLARQYLGDHNNYLYIMNIDGSNMHALIPDSTVSSCDWSK